MSYALINTMDAWWETTLDFLTSFEYINIIMYYPVEMYGNFEGTYEYCTFNQYLDQLLMISNLDYAYMADVVVRDSILIAMDIGTVTANYNDYLSDEN